MSKCTCHHEIATHGRRPLAQDPTRTTTLRRRYLSEMRKRFRDLRGDIRRLIVEEGALGESQSTVTTNRFQFRTDAGKVKGFQEWLDGRFAAGVLAPAEGGGNWSDTYIESAYRQGLVRAYIDSRAVELLQEDDPLFIGGKEEFLRTAFAAPETRSKLELLQIRAFEDLRGVTASMSTEMGRVLADGLADGRSPLDIAKDLNKVVTRLTNARALTIARTEIIHAHSEGQLDSFERLGVDELGVIAEYSTAGDDRVCEQCAALEGQTFTVEEARGIIPVHPNCRCTWIPSRGK